MLGKTAGTVIALGLLLSSLPADARARARASRPVTARKGAVQSGFTDRIAPGHFQLETNLADWQSGDPQTVIVGDSVLRIGVLRDTELQLGWTPYFSSGDRKGSGDIRLGFRQILREARFGVVLQPVVVLPTGSKSVTAGHLTGGATLGLTYEISHTTQLYATPTVFFLPQTLVSSTVGVNQHVKGPVDTALEVFTQHQMGDPTQSQYSLGSITTYKFNERFEINAGVNVGLNANTPPVELVIGFTRAF